MDFHYSGCASDASDQCNVADEIETQIVVECRVPRIRRRSFQQGVTIGGRPRDNLRGEIATSARPILDHKRLAEAFRQPLADQPRTGVKWTARGKADEQMYWPRRIIERRCDPRQGRKRSGTRCHMQEFAAGKFHWWLHELSTVHLPKAPRGNRSAMSVTLIHLRQKSSPLSSERSPSSFERASRYERRLLQAWL